MRRQIHQKVGLTPSSITCYESMVSSVTSTLFVILYICAGPFTFSLHARKTTLKLTAKNAEDADEWIGALQDVSIFQLHLPCAAVNMVHVVY